MAVFAKSKRSQFVFSIVAENTPPSNHALQRMRVNVAGEFGW